MGKWIAGMCVIVIVAKLIPLSERSYMIALRVVLADTVSKEGDFVTRIAYFTHPASLAE